MKRILLFFIIMATALNAGLAQNVDDALRYSQLFYNGTARFNSMGGAFTALGGDLSSLGQNPAGIGVFRTSELSISPQLFNFNTVSNFHGKSQDDYLYDFSLGQAGLVLNLRNSSNTTGLLSLNVGYSFNRTNYLNQTIRISGMSENSSLLDSWAKTGTDIIDQWQFSHPGMIPDIDSLLVNSSYAETHLGWWTWLLDTIPGSNHVLGTAYTDYGRYPAEYGKNMTRTLSTTGYTGEHNISIGANYSNNLFLGATLAITRLSYESRLDHSEVSDSTLASGFRQFDYSLYYKNWGTGYSLKLGLIYKPVEPLRLGFSFQSPTLFRINEYANDNIVSQVEGKTDETQENDPMWYKYALTTPFRATAGAAYQFGKMGVLSAEYEFVDYGMARFSETGDNYDYSFKNNSIKKSLKSASNIRVGGELRLNRVYLRGGYGYYGRAYKSGETNSNIAYNSLSLGTGFRDRNIYIDLGFTTITNPQRYMLYSYETSPEEFTTESSDLNIRRNIITVSFGYKFGY